MEAENLVCTTSSDDEKIDHKLEVEREKMKEKKGKKKTSSLIRFARLTPSF